MKITILKVLFAAGLAGLQLKFLPNVSMLGWVFVAVLIDFITGVIKSKLQDKTLNSQGFRQTSIKCLQYLGLIVGCIILGNTVDKDNQIVKWINDGMLIFIIYVEVYSIFENLYAMNPDSKVATFIFKPAMRILTIGLEKNSLNKIADDAEKAAKVVVVTTSILLLSSCKVVKPGVDTSYTKTDTTITNYKPVDAHYKGASVGASFNYDSAMNGMFEKWVKMLPVAQQSLNVDSLYKVFKGSLKSGEIKTITDPETKVQLQYWVDEFGKLQMTCSSKDQTIQMMVAEITRLTKEATKEKKTEVVYKMPTWGWIVIGISIIPTIIVLIILSRFIRDEIKKKK